MGKLEIAVPELTAVSNTPARNGFEEILQRALSLRELGLLDKAVVEYENLLKTDCPPSRIIPSMVDCLSKNHSPSKIIQKIDKVVHQLRLSDLRIAQINFVLGLENESRGHEDLALDMYRAASEADPKNEKLYRRLTSLFRNCTQVPDMITCF